MYAVEIDSWARYWWYYYYFEWSYKRNIIYGRGQQVDKILILKPKNNIHAFKPTYTQNREKNLINICTGEDIEPICISGFVVLYKFYEWCNK